MSSTHLFPEINLPQNRQIGTFGDGMFSDTKHIKVSYNDISCSNLLLSSDQIIERWNYDKMDIITKIKDGIKSFHIQDIFPCDSSCLYSVNKSAKIFEKRQMCIGCCLVNNIVGLNKNYNDINILVGKYVGLQLFVTESKDNIKGFEITDEPIKVSFKLKNKLEHLQICEPMLNDYTSFTTFLQTSSTVDQYIIVSSIIEYELRKANISMILPFRWAFKCGKMSYLVEEKLDLGKGSLEEIIKNWSEISSDALSLSGKQLISRNVFRGIIMQIVAILRFLSEFVFTHGEPSISYLGFSKKPSVFRYDGKKIISPITTSIIPSGRSSISFRTENSRDKTFIRFSSNISNKKDVNSEFLPIIQVQPFLSKISYNGTCIATKSVTPCLPELAASRVAGYKIGHFKELFCHNVQNLGIPLFHSSFDLYLFMISLMCNPIFYNSMSADSQMLQFWKELWLIREYDNVMSTIKNLDPKSNFYTILDKFCNFTFRCDALEHFWHRLKML